MEAGNGKSPLNFFVLKTLQLSCNLMAKKPLSNNYQKGCEIKALIYFLFLATLSQEFNSHNCQGILMFSLFYALFFYFIFLTNQSRYIAYHAYL